MARVMRDVVQIVALDADASKDISDSFGVKEFPTLLFYGQDKTAPVKFKDERKL